MIDRNKLKVMGRVWSVDSVAKNASTSFYGNIVSLTESPVQEGLLYAGTDDGLIQVTEDGGTNWRRIAKFPGIPEMTYISDLTASHQDANTVYASFNNHKMGDFKPYLLKSTDRGRSWTSIAGDLPVRGSVWTVAEDPVNRNLMFAGTEFGIFFSANGGTNWIQLKGNVPTIAVRDIAIQTRENDLVLATFGRGFVILDDYTSLRQVSEQNLQQDVLFPVREAQMFIPSVSLGFPGKGFQGDAYFSAPNPPFGAVFTYYLNEEIKSKKDSRLAEEKKIAEKSGDTPYPTWDALRAEDREEKPALLLMITDEEGRVVRRIPGSVKSGFHRTAWDLRYPPFEPTQLEDKTDRAPWERPPIGPMAPPGTYRVQMAKRLDDKLEMIGSPQTFTTETLGLATLPEPDRKQLIAFQQKTGRLARAVWGAAESLKEAQTRIKLLKKALDDTPNASHQLREQARALKLRFAEMDVTLNGDSTLSKRNEASLPGLADRVQSIVTGNWTTTSAATNTQRRQYEIVATDFEQFMAELRKSIEVDLKALENEAEKAGAPWTPGRLPSWQKE